MQLKLITPEAEILSTESDYVTVPGEVGELGILPQHTSLVSLLTGGVMTTTRAGKTDHFQISGGHVEVAADVVVVMADSATAAFAASMDEASTF